MAEESYAKHLMTVRLKTLIQKVTPRGYRASAMPAKQQSRIPVSSGWVDKYDPALNMHYRAYQPNSSGVNRLLDKFSAYKKDLRVKQRQGQGMTAGNLSLNDYRFWIGSPNPGSMFSKCRACGQIATNVGERRKHQREESCTVLLCATYKNLAPDASTKAYCVCCEEETYGRRWAVPICKKQACLDKFMFDHSEKFPMLKGTMVLLLNKPNGLKRRLGKSWNDEAI